ncbi:hypothetical protein ACFVVU_30605 [Kitasatospora sp. NPDC057965]|uniref:hypothetical protein n=1 Tax=Kitasatospora sp. NPDC057965 TaxID=3346291 RepID=UPI0036DB156A
MATFTIPIAVDPATDVLAALPVDGASRRLLDQAGFVHDEATGVQRLRESTSPTSASRAVTDAVHRLNAVGYDVLRLYSDTERRKAITQPAPDDPTMTRAPGTIWMHHVASDVTAGRLVVHALHREAAGPVRLLAGFPTDGTAAVLATEGSGFFAVTEYKDLDAAVAAFGYPLVAPFPQPDSCATA